MAVQTPSYWNDEKYQPLVEMETAYGNRVEIPKLYEEHWKMHCRQREYLIEMWNRASRDGLLQETSHSRGQWALDLIKTFLEVYGK